MNNYADVCVNLLNSQFNDDRQALLDRAKAHGVDKILLTATDVDSSKAAQVLLETGFLYGTAGVHPHDAGGRSSQWLSELGELVKHPLVKAVGETGLDFNRDYSPREQQIACFCDQIELAVRVDKPLFVHDRESGGMVLKLLSNYRALPPVLIHCFTGTRSELEGYLAAGFYIGITGWVTDQRRGAELRELVPLIPLNRLMVETDAPFLKPHNLPTSVTSGQPRRRNEPAYLPWVVAQIAELYDQDPAQIAQATRNNAIEFFKFND